MTEWSAISRRVIGEVHASLPANATLAERSAAILVAYPFGAKDSPRWPYKAWLNARRAYLSRFRPQGQTALDLLPRDPATGRPMT